MPFTRRAQWVWVRPPRQEVDPFAPQPRELTDPDTNRYVYFRKTFQINRLPGRSPVWVSADGRYQLYVNGVLAGRGPARCHPERQCLDRYDIRPLLRRGGNAVCCLVHTYGRHTSWYQVAVGLQALFFGSGGFFLQGELQGEPAVRLDTGPEWKYLISEAWARQAAFGGTGFAEDYATSAAPAGWTGVEFDDSAWAAARVLRAPSPLGGSDVVPFPVLEPRDIPPLAERSLRPCALSAAGGGGPGDGNSLLERFREERIRDAAPQLSLDGLFTGRAPTALPKAGKACLILVLDFGRVVLGRLRFAVEAPTGAELLFAVGESLDSLGQVEVPEEVPGIASPLVHRVRLAAGLQEFEQFEAGGGRYVEVHLRSRGPVLLHSLAMVACAYPSSKTGRFECADALLSRIWAAGEYTARVCRQDGFIDCPSREQRQWVGDGYVQSLVGFVTEKDTRLALRYLRQVSETQRPDGLLQMATTCDLQAESPVTVPDFSLLWILAVERYLLYAGDRQAAGELYPSLLRALCWFLEYLAADGLLTDVPGWTFIDWSTELDRRGAVTALNALFCAAVRAAGCIASACGIRWPDRGLAATAARLQEQLNTRLWNESRGAYSDSLRAGELSPVVSQQANSLMVCYGIAPRGRWRRVLRTILDESCLRLTRNWEWDRERPFDSAHDVVLAQPFHSHFLHAALRRAGMTASIVRNIRGRWAEMAEHGGTCWESWQITPHTSRCHGFSATPVYDLATSVLGIRPLRPGYGRFEIRPWLDGLASARGQVPTPAGPIGLSWEAAGKGLKLRVRVPEGLTGELKIPLGFEPRRVRLSSGDLTFELRRSPT